MRNNQRQFYIFDLEIAARKAGATVPAMIDVLPIFQRMHAASRTYQIKGDTGTMLIGDISVDAGQRLFTLLIRLSDRAAPNSVYSDPLTGQFDEHLKVGNVGSDFGCHVLVSTAPELALPNIYTCAIERVPNLASQLVQRLLSKLLSFEYHEDLASFQYLDPAGGRHRQGNARMARCMPHIELRARPSDDFVNDINNSRLSGITLIRSEKVTPIAGAAFLYKEKSELKLGIDHKNLPAQIWSTLTGVLKAHAQIYQHAKIAYKMPNSDRVVTVEIDADTGSPLNDLYVLSVELTNIFPFLAQSAQNIVPHLRDLASPVLIQHRTV